MVRGIHDVAGSDTSLVRNSVSHLEISCLQVRRATNQPAEWPRLGARTRPCRSSFFDKKQLLFVKTLPSLSYISYVRIFFMDNELRDYIVECWGIPEEDIGIITVNEAEAIKQTFDYEIWYFNKAIYKYYKAVKSCILE